MTKTRTGSWFKPSISGWREKKDGEVVRGEGDVRCGEVECGEREEGMWKRWSMGRGGVKGAIIRIKFHGALSPLNSRRL